MTEDEELQYWKLPPLAISHVLFYEGSSHWLIRASRRLPPALQTRVMLAVIRWTFSKVVKNYQRYLVHHRLGQDDAPASLTPPAITVPPPSEWRKSLYEGMRPSQDQFVMYEALISDELETGAVAQREKASQLLEARTARKYKYYAQLLLDGRKRYIKAALDR